MKKFSERIYELRKENSFTQEEIANHLNVTRQTISNWETDSAQPTIDKAIELAALYNVSLDELIGHKRENIKKESEILRSLLGKVVTLHLVPDTDVFISIGNTEIKNCTIIDVRPNCIRIIMTDKKLKIEKTIFLKDILGFEMEVE